MTKYLPVNLKVKGKSCLVVGGGKVALRKVAKLLDCEAKVTVISPKLCDGLKNQHINWHKKKYSAACLAGAYLVVAATDDRKINAQVAKDCQPRNILVNVVDSVAVSDYIFPAVLRKNNLVIAVSTDGKNPSRAKEIKNELAAYRFKS